MLAYSVIVATAVAGLVGMNYWAAIACGSVLALISIVEHQRWEAGLTGSYRKIALNAATITSMVNGCLAGTAAYVLGLATRLIWGT